MRPDPTIARGGYLTIDALVALAVTTIAVTAAVGLAAQTAARVTSARDRLAAAQTAARLYEDLYQGRRPDGVHMGAEGGRAWRYTLSRTKDADVRTGSLSVDRRGREPLKVALALPPAPATASSN